MQPCDDREGRQAGRVSAIRETAFSIAASVIGWKGIQERYGIAKDQTQKSTIEWIFRL